MIVTCECPHCGQKIEFELEALNTDAPCPQCGNTIKLAPARAAPIVPPAAAPVVASAVLGRPVKEYLKKLRENSCYGALRTLIDVSFLLCVIGCLLTGVTMGLMDSGTGGRVMAVSITVLGTVLLIAFRQAAFVVIDIADALIHEGNKTFKQQ
jgi:hypothetical protein